MTSIRPRSGRRLALRIATLIGATLVARSAVAINAPSNVQGTALGPTSAQVTWQDNSSDEDYQVVERAPSGSSAWADASPQLPPNQVTFDDSGAVVALDEGTSYAYRVRACKTTNCNGGARKTSSPSPDVVTPLFAPTDASAVYGPPQQVALSWTDISLRNTAYTVERKATVDADWQTLTSTLGATATSYTDASPLDGRSYSYRITATRTSPTSASGGALASATTPWLDPAGLSISLDDHARPVLSWQDNSTGELAYVVERRNDLAVYDCPVALQRGNGWCEVAQAPPNPSGGGTTYVDSSLRIDPVDPAEYQYRVHAIAGTSASADTSSWSPSCKGPSPANPLLAWSDARVANGSPTWPLPVPPPTDTTLVSAARLTSGTWATCNAGGTPGTLPPVPPAGCTWSACTLGDVGCTSPELILLSNSLYVALFTWRGSLIGLTHRLHGAEFIHPSGPLGDQPHGWQIEFGSASTKLGTGTSFISQSGSTPSPAISVDTSSGVMLRFTWTAIPNVSATIENTWRLNAVGSSGLRGRMQVAGTATAGFPLFVVFPQVTQVTNAWTDGNYDYIVPIGPGAIQPGFGGNDARTLLTPGWTAQFGGIARGDAALYLAAEDPAQHPKRFLHNKPVLSGFLFFPEAVVPPASDEFSMDYDVVLAPMCAQTRSLAATRIAKRYRRFMLASDWLKRPGDVTPVRLAERTDIPTKLRDGVYWWTYFLRKFTVYGDGLTLDADGVNSRVVGVNPFLDQGQFCGPPNHFNGQCSFVRHLNPDATYSFYRLVYKDVSTGGVYVYPGDPGIPGPPASRLYIDPMTDPNWELANGRQLAQLFDISAAQTRDVFVFDAKKWACFFRNGSSSSLPVGFHVYDWYTPGFGKGEPQFDMIPGFDLGIAALESADPNPFTFQGTTCGPTAAEEHAVMPYILTGWGDVSGTYGGANLAYDQSPLILPMAMHLESGQHWCLHSDCSVPFTAGQQYARMSGGVPEWRQLVGSLAASVFGPVGAPAVYLDTYGGGFDLNATDAQGSGLPRDHQPGRGLWHMTGERAIGDLVRQQKPNGVGLVAAEHATEAFLTNVDLITWYPPVLPTHAPLMQAVYSGYRMFAGPVASAVNQTVGAYTMKVANTFVSGNQIGISNQTPFSPPNVFHLISDAGREMLLYSNRLAKARLDLKCYLAYGELLGGSDPDPSIPPADNVTETWVNWNGGSQVVTQPAIRGSRWVSNLGGGCSAGRAIVLTNSTNVDRQAHIPVPNNWAGTTPDLCSSDDTGCTAVALEPAPGGGWHTATLTVPAREARYLHFGP